MVGAGHVCGTRGSCIVSSAANVLEMSVVCGMSEVGGICEMFMCLARGGVGGEGREGMRIGFGLYQPVGIGPLLLRREVSTQFAQQFVTFLTATLLVGGVIWSRRHMVPHDNSKL